MLSRQFGALRKRASALIIRFPLGATAVLTMHGAVKGLVAVTAIAIAAAPAFADPDLAELQGKFARGEYMEAAQQAEASSKADDLAFAARALLAHCMTGASEPDTSIVDRASKDAEAALKLDPDHEEGRLQLAIALSLKSRAMDVLDAWRKGYGEKGKRLAADVLRSDPANFYAHGFLAVWNVEVRRRGGSVGAGIMGASLKAARQHYQRAASLAPDDVGIHWQYGRALAALDATKYGKEAIKALDQAVAAHAGDHVETVMQERAKELIDMLKADRASGQKLARKML
jgi:tetratricopeptide (TPR) repeat protein